MIKRVLFIFCLVVLASCGSKKSTLTGKKVKDKELVSKNAYREELRRKELEKQKQTNTTVASKPESKPSTPSKNNSKEVLTATSSVQVTADLISTYILTYKEVAKSNMADHGIPASITLAQGVLESGSGQGTLARMANNHFGIKCHVEWNGPSVRHTDDAPDECFRKYESPSESYRDHSLFLTSRSRYNTLFELPKSDYKAWAHGLKKAGYATDPKYAEKLISLIERYSLYEYDQELLVSIGQYSKNEVKVDSKPTVSNSSGATSKTHVVKKGDTLYSISKLYNTSVAQVQKINQLKGSMLSIGQVLKIR
ncbi:glucosaminidase domain-containing protein [Myroides sp. LJL116]